MVPKRTARVRLIGETEVTSKNVLVCKKDERSQTLQTSASVSGLLFGRDMREVLGAPNGLRTVIFPKMVRKICQGSFYDVRPLRSVILNEGLEALGTDEYQPDGDLYKGVF